MARTKNPHKATVKSWETRRRNAKLKGATVTKGDFAGTSGLASPQRIKSLIRTPSSDAGDERFWGTRVTGDPTLERMPKVKAILEREARKGMPIQKQIAAVLKEALTAQSYEIPNLALDGLASIDVQPDRAFRYKDQRKKPEEIAGHYRGGTLTARINADTILRVARKSSISETVSFADDQMSFEEATESNLMRRAPHTAAHEIGHHVHLSRLTPEAASEFAMLSKNGKTARLSDYARENTAEHFAETFSAYCCTSSFTAHGQFWRGSLKISEPKVYAFMERLFRTPSMWRPNGEAEYEEWRSVEGHELD